MSYKKILSMFIFTLFIVSQSLAQGLYGNLSEFSVNSEYLTSSGKIKLSTTGTTVVKYKVTISRSIDGSNQSPNNSDFNWHATHIGIGLGINSTNGYTWFPGSVVITNADFPKYVTTIVKELTATINNSQLVSGSKIFLVYDVRPPGTPSQSWVKSQYLPGEYGFEYPVTTFYNDKKYQYFLKNNCSSFQEYPISYFYIVNANKYSSTISKADANSKAELEITQNGQTAANTAGLCYVSMPTPRETIRLHLGYVEDIDWDPSMSPGNATVKIELLIRKDLSAGENYTLFKVLYENAPNTGKVVDGINSALIDFPSIGDYRIKITASNGNVYYLTDQFSLEADRD